MASPISPVIADFVMEEIEKTASAAAPRPQRGGSVTLKIVTRLLERTQWMSFTNISFQLTPPYSSL